MGLLGDAVTIKTMQGWVAIKPYGYAGDHELIDKMYTKWVSLDPMTQKWDHYFHSQSASKAVRNRKDYFIELLKKVVDECKNSSCSVLNVGSRPGRDVFEFLNLKITKNIKFDFVDMDSNAITYSKAVCGKYSNLIKFHSKNIFRYKTNDKYNLVWSAGLFDYLDDKQFVFLLKRLHSMVTPCSGLIAPDTTDGGNAGFASLHGCNLLGQCICTGRTALGQCRSNEAVCRGAKTCHAGYSLWR